jgi:hypothetical protein
VRDGGGPLALIGAALFNVFFYVWTLVLSALVLPAYPFLSDRGMRAVARLWAGVMLGALGVLTGVGTRSAGGRRKHPRSSPVSTSRPGRRSPSSPWRATCRSG